MMLAEYRVDTGLFAGPVELLLYLVRRQEVDICDISVSRIAQDFEAWFDQSVEADFEVLGDFAVVGSTLLEIKSREVLPAEAEAEQTDEVVEDSDSDLVRRLMQYRRYKEAAKQLEEHAAEWMERYPRLSRHRPAVARDASEDRIREVEIWDLVSALARIVQIPDLQKTIALRMDETPMSVYQEQIRERILKDGRAAFSSFFTGERNQSRIVGIFLAILELVRHEGYRAEQPLDYDEIWILSPVARAGY